MKKAILVLTLIFASLPLIAISQPFIRQYNESYTVDLASNAYLSHKTGATYKEYKSPPYGERNTDFYYREQELGVVGILGTRHADSSVDDITVLVPQTSGAPKSYNVGKYVANGAVTITVELLSGEWFYTLDGSAYKRPFGLDLFARGKVKPKSGGDLDADIPGYTLHLGNQAFTHGEADGSFTTTMPESVVACYDYLWWDICLVMDPEADTSTDTVVFNGVEYPLLPSNITYNVDLQITLSCTDGSSSTFPFHLEGFYKTDAISSGSTSGTVGILTVNTIANDFRLDGATGLIETRNVRQQIAKYDFTTTSKTSADKNSKVYLFLSSSSTAYNTGEQFALHHVKDPHGMYVKPLTFNVIMESITKERGDGLWNNYFRPLPHRRNGTDPGSAPTPPGENATEEQIAAYQQALDAYNSSMDQYRTVVFDGTDRFVVNGNTIPSNSMEIYGEITRQKPNTYYTRWQDNGNIYIQMTGYDTEGNTVDVSSLPPGQYTENIYMHVIMF